MKILYVSQYFPPEMGAPAARVSELTRIWAEAGHEVTVLTGFPNHPTGVVAADYKAKMRRLIYRESANGVSIVRTWLIPFPNRKPYERILNYTSFLVSSCITGIFLKRPDVVIATSPQLFVGLTGWVLGKVKRTPFVLEIRDIWPDAIIASGVGKEDTAFARALRALSRFLYGASQHIVVVTNAFKEELTTRYGVATDKVSVVHNGVDTELFSPTGTMMEVRKTEGLEHNFVVSYIGTVGFAHGLGSLLDAASLLQHEFPEILFLIVGEGADKHNLVAEGHKRRLGNVRFIGQRPRSEVPHYIRASDACLVLLKRAEVFKTVIPTKMLEFMACGRPLILGVDGEARDLMNRACAGIFVEPEDPAALARAVVDLAHDPSLGVVLGKGGQEFVRAHFSRAKTAREYLDLLVKLGGRRSKGRPFGHQGAL